MVEPLTAGIIPHQVESPYSNMVIYDLAGHHQYFSSHSAYLEAISDTSPAIFLLQYLRKDSEAITKELYYWSAMINGVCHKCPQQSSVIIVGTHADLLTPEELSRKITYLKSVAKTAIRHQKLVKVLALNLTKLYRDEMDQFVNLLHKTNKGIISACPSISRKCHIMLDFLEDKIPHHPVAMSLPDLLAHLHADQRKLIDPDISSIVPLLEILSEKGLIAYIPSEDPFNSWIVSASLRRSMELCLQIRLFRSIPSLLVILG